MLAPGWYPDYSTIARFCNEQGAYDFALQAAMAGLARTPDDPLLHLRVAQSEDGMGNVEGAIIRCTAALSLAPAPSVEAQILATLALAYEHAGRIDLALATAQRAINASPEAIEPHVVYGGILARGGAYREAWRELEFFFLDERAWCRRRFGRPEWNGEDLHGRRLLVVHGQGAGDLIQMARYLPALRARVSEVVVEAPPSLAATLATIAGVQIAGKDTVASAVTDVFTRAMALPRILGETGADPPCGAYVRVLPDRAERWNARLGPRDGRLRVGLVWAGNPYHSNDFLRSLSLAAFAPLAAFGGVSWISLQVGPRARDVAPPGLALTRVDDAIGDFADTAAIIAACDLVIAVDTAVAHLAGALGAPVWLLVPSRPEWRWPRAGERSPWYASMRLVHADRSGWSAAIDRVVTLLAERVAMPSAEGR